MSDLPGDAQTRLLHLEKHSFKPAPALTSLQGQMSSLPPFTALLVSAFPFPRTYREDNRARQVLGSKFFCRSARCFPSHWLCSCCCPASALPASPGQSPGRATTAPLQQVCSSSRSFCNTPWQGDIAKHYFSQFLFWRSQDEQSLTTQCPVASAK